MNENKNQYKIVDKIKEIVGCKEDFCFYNVGVFVNLNTSKEYDFRAFKNDNCDLRIILETIGELKEVPFYLSEECPYTFEQMSSFIEDVLHAFCLKTSTIRNIKMQQFQTSTDELNKYFLRALFYLQEEEYYEALRNLNIYNSYGEMIFNSYPHLFYYRGIAYYGLHEYDKAKLDLQHYQNSVPGDELVHLYLGNISLIQGRYVEALDEYIAALEIHGNFPEVMTNAEIIHQHIAMKNDDKFDKSSMFKNITGLDCDMHISPCMDILEIPIFINNFNRLGCLQQLVDWLVAAGYRKIYILDNNSTYPPLLEYYQTLSDSVCVIRLAKNWGHKALWCSGILEFMKITGPYVYTDSDVLPTDSCPKDILSNLLGILKKYPFLKKVGLGLVTDDITCVEAEKIKKIEARYYMHEMEEDVYFGAVDTTFALYRDYRHYSLYVSARTSGKFMARHLPWYYDYENLPDDEKYYAEHANKSASLIHNLKKKKIL